MQSSIVKVLQGTALGTSLGLAAYGAYAQCCRNEYQWIPARICEPLRRICDMDPVYTGPERRHATGYRQRICADYEGEYAAGPCSMPPPGEGWQPLPGYGPGCCWFRGTLKNVEILGQVARCDGMPCAGSSEED